MRRRNRRLVFAVFWVVVAAVFAYWIYGWQTQKAAVPAPAPAKKPPMAHHHRKPKNLYTDLVPHVTLHGRSLHVVFLGDSLTHGALASSPAAAFPAMVTNSIRHHMTVTATVEGAPGMGVDYWLARPSAIPTDAGLVVIELGTNDIDDTDSYLEAARKFTADYEALQQMIYRRAPNAQVVCVSVWDHQDVPTTHLYNDAIGRTCTGAFVGIDDIAAQPGTRGPDGFHPNDKGHRLIADAVLSMIRY